MAFNHNVVKQNARSQLDKFDENKAIVLFDPKIAYEHLVDQKKSLEKEYIASDLRSVRHRIKIERAERQVERVRGQKASKAYWATKGPGPAAAAQIYGELHHEYTSLGPQYAAPVAPETEEDKPDIEQDEREGGATPDWADEKTDRRRRRVRRRLRRSRGRVPAHAGDEERGAPRQERDQGAGGGVSGARGDGAVLYAKAGGEKEGGDAGCGG